MVVHEVEGLLDTPISFWSDLSLLVDSDELDRKTIRNDTLTALHTKIGYLYFDFFHQLEILPLSLTQGDISENCRCCGEPSLMTPSIIAH